MPMIRNELARSLARERAAIQTLQRECGERIIGHVTVRQLTGGLRGVNALVCDTSAVDPVRGLIVRGIPVLELIDRLSEEVFHLLATGVLPTAAQLADLQSHLQHRAGVPAYVWQVLEEAKPDAHPMALLSIAVLALKRESVFARRIWEKQEHRFWEFALDDALTLIARLPVIAAGVYRMRCGKRPLTSIAPDLDWSANLAHLLGLPETEEVREFMRRYLVVHCDHESGNATAFAFNTVASALGDPYSALSAGFNALAGPLHGAASQGSMEFIADIRARFGDQATAAQVAELIWERLNTGRVIPGYGHAVLRAVDPRFLALHEFGLQHFPDDPVLRIADLIYQVAPRILQEHGRAASPYPNVDAITGALLYHYGIVEQEFYTVLFGLGLALGLLAQFIVLHGIGVKLLRPRSITTANLWVLAEALTGSRPTLD